ncbi:hypothetical protein BH23PSE1_BH23PSE1_16210 [soil metagenome]
MFLSVFDIFKIGIGPSSSHTMGPMLAAARFLGALRAGDETVPGAGPPERLRVRLHGSLALTGKGHATDRAVMLGLLGFLPDTFDAPAAEAALEALAAAKTLRPRDLPPLAFDPATSIAFDFGPPLPRHTNGLVFEALDARGALHLAATYYSIGGGFVLTERELDRPAAAGGPGVPYPFAAAGALLQHANASGLSIAAIQRANEAARLDPGALDAGLRRLWQVMSASIDRGLAAEAAELPGGLRVRRRAGAIHARLAA